MPAEIDAVLFDLDGTLVEYERSTGEVLDLAFERAGIDPFFEVGEYLDRYNDHLGPDLTIAEGRSNCFAAIAEDCGHDPERGRAVAEAFAEARDHSRVDLVSGARETLDALARDHAVGVVTNGPPEMQTTKLEAAGLLDRFETVVYAGHDVVRTRDVLTGSEITRFPNAAAKPDPEPFEVALDALNSHCSRAVHVGDTLSSDVAGAHAAGLQSVWVPAEDGVEPDPEPNHAFESLAELADPPWLG